MLSYSNAFNKYKHNSVRADLSLEVLHPPLELDDLHV